MAKGTEVERVDLREVHMRTNIAMVSSCAVDGTRRGLAVGERRVLLSVVTMLGDHALCWVVDTWRAPKDSGVYTKVSDKIARIPLDGLLEPHDDLVEVEEIPAGLYTNRGHNFRAIPEEAWLPASYPCETFEVIG